jgi:hypothetical protein
MTEDPDPELSRKRATNAARVADNELPPPIALKRVRILRWNGEAPPPQVTHWTKRGAFAIRAHTPGKVTEVLFDNRHLGFGGDPTTAARNLFEGSYDAELGFAALELVPSRLNEWNDLGG